MQHATELYAWERIIGAGGHVIPNVTLERATEDRYYLDLGFSGGWYMDPDWDQNPVDDVFTCIPTLPTRAIKQGAALSTNPPKSKAQIAKEHRSRAEREHIAYQMRLDDRYDELGQWYEELLEDVDDLNEDELPNEHDGARLFATLATRNDARAGINQDSVGALEGFVLARARAYTFDVRSALAALLPPPSPVHHRDMRGTRLLCDTLARPTALFACGFHGCQGYHGFEWPEINWHWRDAHRDESVWVPIFGGTLDRYIRATVWREGAELANRILGAAGLPLDTRMDRLDKLCRKGRLGCACGDPDLPERSLNWGQLVRHVHDHLKVDEYRRPCNGIPWIEDHRDLQSCIKLLPKSANTKAAFPHATADAGTTARVDSFRASRPEGTRLVCLLCVPMFNHKRAIALGLEPFLLPIADEIVYHMQAKHGIPFDEKNISFHPYVEPPPPEKVQLDLRKFCQD
ncbi:hypothetical protein GSI_03152 [Ganoderma sinense ZZ0214-1]|uniref:Uncharacterized protein n=1 Tax=Ganoderma sinense ZZ0214-1 TaxID=1077348 RepID=A0A2G8SKU5_9APHY|nr:hypothetical protein GSI_03152 [Ganoderma sinense ZZ0214-1]